MSLECWTLDSNQYLRICFKATPEDHHFLRSTIALIQHNTEMLASTNRFWILLLFASLYYITAWTKKYYVITKEERSSPIIVKFAVIKLRGGFKPHFCHTRPVVCPSWTSASSATRKHCYITMLMYGWRGRPPWWPPFFLIIVIKRISGTAPASG